MKCVIRILTRWLLLGLLGLCASASAFATNWEVKKDGVNKLVAPFGFASRQPPTMEYVKIIDVKVGLEAQQVCGYTDWTTTQIHLPKQLLSKQYWKNVGTRIMQTAQKVVMDLSGALPSMLACNVSPTFCSVLNQAELMAGFEQSLTFETCNILDDVANTGAFQSGALKGCIRSYLAAKEKKNETATNSEAREACLNKADKDGPSSNKDKLEQISSKTENDENHQQANHFDLQKFVDSLFPGEVKTTERVYSFERDGFTYSRRKKSKDFVKKIFLKGINLRGSAMVEVGGTFQGTIEKEKDIEQSKLRMAILVILREMRENQQKGCSEREIIRRSEHNWKDKNKWKQDKEPHPIYRPSGNEAEPTFLISPEQILMLLPLVGDSDANFESDDLRQVLDRLSSAATHVKITDRLIDTYRETFRVCRTDPKYQDSVAQKNCESMLKDISSNMQFLQYQNNTETDAMKTQQEVREYIQHVQEHRGLLRKSEPMPPYEFNNYFVPGRY
ncbi:MAG: hypothetical protein HQK53_05635 [Oligoflexia bacterium]|nr:hypothetical protein [Oligoflexia bacterium]